MISAQKCIGRLYRHTAKAVRNAGSNPISPAHSDRVYAVVSVDDSGYLVAWKCGLLKDGKIAHPAFRRPLKANDPRVFVSQGRQGETPTALIRLDSYYKEYKPHTS